MPIYATSAAKAFWGDGKQRARSLAVSRFCPLKTNGDQSDNSYRKHYCDQLKHGKINEQLLSSRSSFSSLINDRGGLQFFAKLEARLILNAAGGVIENGGLSLDRNSGVPFIPGSAIKGAARRHAIWKLSQEKNPERKVELLTQIAGLFGYGNQEWLPGRRSSNDHPSGGAAISDFWLAMVPVEENGSESDHLRDELWNQIGAKAKDAISKRFGRNTFPSQMSGGISFLPAFPTKDLGIDLDIINCHHPDYYNGDRMVALDDENPIPVMIPTIPQGTSFQFCLFPSQPFISGDDLTVAQNHLTKALQIFGLGAKTNAGYGWFSVDVAALKKAEEERKDEIERKSEDLRRSKMSEEECIVEDLKKLDPQKFALLMSELAEKNEITQRIACKMLLEGKREEWKGWTRQKKGKWVDRIPRIREIAKRHNITLP